ncbi:hypothetical protein N7448_005190 [Penicillium atrosanguineum]|uniref:Yeast cell wall synthesis Kre9/Knh1-like N-terminal domain-containing protein n=1 Tax=Penicillium atrosanguineum TaxID=1132637 RepID=A0A9W9L4V4_9EURO|nr:hypothetical protein N7526_008055 [Penicillium atrosanguineum]KAJ5136636.1 hypothetical protein N7448_005190 [Penicillium atrosanguineum]KAJ5302995.1 hypothetical protein N7476_009794 [Penicillium atrosanguineum]
MRVAAMTSLMAFAVSAAGIVITSPRIGEKIDFSKPVTIKWQRVSTDPTTVDIVLVNEDVYPPVTETVASGVDADMGSYTIKAHKEDVSVSDTGGGYQVNFLSPSGGILAQSQQFKVTVPKIEASTSDPFSFIVEFCLKQHCPLKHPYEHQFFLFALKNAHFFFKAPFFHVSFTPHLYSCSMSTKSHTTETTTTTKHMKSTMTSSATATSTSNAAGLILPPNQAGSLLLGLFACVL